MLVHTIDERTIEVEQERGRLKGGVGVAIGHSI
jgi:hypothetical protein